MSAPAPALSLPRQSPVRGLLAPLVQPALFDFWATHVNRAWSWERPRARIIASEAASSDCVTLWLKPNRHVGSFVAGQHLHITAEVDGRRITRSYSPNCAPQADGRFSITVKRVAGGRMSNHLCDAARVGDVLDVGDGYGDMTLPQNPAHPLLLLAAGSGITPLVALVRELVRRGMPVPVSLSYWCARRDEFCFVDELRALAATRPEFRVRFLLTRENALHDDEGNGRIDAAQLAMLTDDMAAQQVFACGPGGFVETARTLLEGNCRTFVAEAFSLPSVVATDEGDVQVTLTRSARTLRVPRGQSLLSALEAEGLKPAHGCRMGICNTCACGKASGTTRHLPSGILFDEPASALKLCINSAVGDLVLDL